MRPARPADGQRPESRRRTAGTAGRASRFGGDARRRVSRERDPFSGAFGRSTAGSLRLGTPVMKTGFFYVHILRSITQTGRLLLAASGWAAFARQAVLTLARRLVLRSLPAKEKASREAERPWPATCPPKHPGEGGSLGEVGSESEQGRARLLFLSIPSLPTRSRLRPGSAVASGSGMEGRSPRSGGKLSLGVRHVQSCFPGACMQ
jgi:hypothetical protein